MALDEYLFGRFVRYLKRRKTSAIQASKHIVKLDDVKGKLTIFASAVSGYPIHIHPAEREGGYKNDSFFLPPRMDHFDSYEQNASFYLFRVLYLAVQKKLGINWPDQLQHDLMESRLKAEEKAPLILRHLFEEVPSTEVIYRQLLELFDAKTKGNSSPDYSFIYGKWMNNRPEETNQKKENSLADKAKMAIKNEITTLLKTRSVEEVFTLEVDKKQQEDYVMTHNFEKIDTAEEHEGGWRDFDGDDDMKDHSQALEDLKMKYTVRVDDEVHSIYQADFVENATVSESADLNTSDFHILYDEWDYTKRTYKKDFCKVYPKKISGTDISYYKKTLVDHRSTLTGLRKMLTTVNNKYQQQRRQRQGDQFDIDAITDLFVDVRCGHTPSEKIYLSARKKEKDLSILMLLDISLSSDGYAAGNRIIDVEKQVSILFGEILDEFNVDFALGCFYSKTRNSTAYLSVKDFSDPWSKAKYKVGTVEPEAYTRIGAAIRHSGALLKERDTKNKWLILISDGKPNDYDRYEGKYGINDIRQALRELRHNNIQSYALAIEAQAKYYLPLMFGQNHYQILTNPVELLQALVLLYERIKHQ